MWREMHVNEMVTFREKKMGKRDQEGASGKFQSYI